MIKNIALAYLGLAVAAGAPVMTVIALPLIAVAVCTPSFWAPRVELND